MKNVDVNLISEEAFSDFPVKNMELDEKRTQCSIMLHGVSVEDSETPYYKNVTILLNDWYKLEIICYPDEGESVIFQGDNISDFYLRDICRFSKDKEFLQLAGFSSAGKGWIEWIFLNPKLRIMGEPDQ